MHDPKRFEAGKPCGWELLEGGEGLVNNTPRAIDPRFRFTRADRHTHTPHTRLTSHPGQRLALEGRVDAQDHFVDPWVRGAGPALAGVDA